MRLLLARSRLLELTESRGTGFRSDPTGKNARKDGVRFVAQLQRAGVVQRARTDRVGWGKARSGLTDSLSSFIYFVAFCEPIETPSAGGCATSMRIEKTDSRARTWEHLKDATDRGHTSQALDRAARYYLRMHGGTPAYPNGVIATLLATADERGSLTAKEIADILDVDELPVEFEQRWSVGREG